MERTRNLIFLESLRNSVAHDGEPSQKAVLGIMMRDYPELRTKKQEVLSIMNEVFEEIRGLSFEEQKNRLLGMDPSALHSHPKEPEKKELPELPNVMKNKVILRLAPFPSGGLHIGNARMLVLNDAYAKKYKGKLLLVFDDTIGSTKHDLMHDREHAKFVLPESYNLIEEGLEWLGIKFHKKYWKSDRTDIYKEQAVDLIRKNQAYVCQCEAQVFREKHKIPGKPCACRGLPVETHLQRWDRMLDGSIPERGAVVRLKTGMHLKDPALRDHVIMRLSDAPHPRIGTKCRVWPTLEFSWGIDDHLLEITHIIRGVDLRKEGEIEKIIWNMHGWSHCEILLYGRLKFGDEFKLSKTFHRTMIEKGIYLGWDDPRTWSLQSLEKRGIKPQAVREALLNLGLSNRSIQFDKNEIYSRNVTLIDPKAHRIFFVNNPVELNVTGIPEGKYVASPLIHPSYEKRGTRDIEITVTNGNSQLFISKNDIGAQYNKKGKKIRFPAFAPGLKIRLKDLFTIIITKVGKQIYANFNVREMENVSMRKIQWVPADINVPVRVLQPDGAFTKGLAERNILKLTEGSIAQFERYGYVKLISVKEEEIFCFFIN